MTAQGSRSAAPGVGLGQPATARSSNEITAIPLLLERLAPSGALVAIADGASARTAQAVLDRGADDRLGLKTSQGHLFEAADLYVRDAAGLQPLQTVDADHGCIETRRHLVSTDVAWLRADRAAPGEPRFPGLKAVARVQAEVEAKVEAGGRAALARRHHLCSAPLDARAFARAVRAQWGVENRLHRVLDVVFHDDLARLRTGHGPEDMAIVRHTAINLLNRTESLKTRRKRAGCDDDDLQAVIPQTA